MFRSNGIRFSLRTDNARFDRGNEWVHIHGRLSPGVSIAQASAAVSAVTSQLAKQYPATNEFKAGIVEAYDPLGSLERSRIRDHSGRRAHPDRNGASGRVPEYLRHDAGSQRDARAGTVDPPGDRREPGTAGPASFGRSDRAGGVSEGLSPRSCSSTFRRCCPGGSGEPLPVQLQEALRVDLSMVAICVGLCLVTSLVFGLLPAARFSRPVIISSLKDDAGVGGFRAGRVHRVTAALQVAIAVPLLVMSGISLDRVRATATADLGFESDLLYAAPLKLDAAARMRSAGFRIRSVRDNLEKASGVASVTVADGLPLDFRGRITRVSLQADANVAPTFVSVQVTRVGDGYLNTMGIPLLRGRGFTADDGAGAEMVTVISKPLADQLFPNADAAEAIGKRLTFGRR